MIDAANAAEDVFSDASAMAWVKSTDGGDIYISVFADERFEREESNTPPAFDIKLADAIRELSRHYRPVTQDAAAQTEEWREVRGKVAGLLAAFDAEWPHGVSASEPSPTDKPPSP